MASITSDLKYLSRYGYRDPWAEAVKSVSDNLFSLANSKMRRDMLIADYQDKQENRAYIQERDAKRDAFELYKGADPLTKLSLLQDEEYSKHFPSGFAESETKIQNGLMAYHTERDNLFKTINQATVITPEVMQAVRRLERIVPGSETGTRARINSMKAGIVSQYGDEQLAKFISNKMELHKTKGLLKEPQYLAVKKALNSKDLINAEKLLTDSLSSNRTAAEDIESYYNDQKSMLMDKANAFSLPQVEGMVTDLEKQLIKFIPPWISSQRTEQGDQIPFVTMLALMKLGKPEGVDDKTYNRIANLPSVIQRREFIENLGGSVMNLRNPNIIESDGTETKENVSSFHMDSENRFALPEDDFAMPPESQVELQYKNGTTKIVNGENAWNQIQRGDVTYASSNKSGIYLKIGSGSNPVLAKKTGSRIPGVNEGDWAGGDVGVVYQNPTRRQYEGINRPVRIKGIGTINAVRSPKLRRTAFSTRNIKLQSGDLLIEPNSGTYHRVTIIEPPPRGTMMMMRQPTSRIESMKAADKWRSSGKLDATIFRVGNKDYTAQELIKKFMIPMSVPDTSKSELEQTTEITNPEPKLISVNPVDADSAWVADSTTWMQPAIPPDTTYK